VYERGNRLGGSMALSSGVIWRHASWDAFREECPEGDPTLQHLVWERLDSAIEWLRRLGAPIIDGETGNPRTLGVRFSTEGLRDVLSARLTPGSVVYEAAPLGGSPDEPIVLATGGFAASAALVEEYIRPASPLRLRANPCSAGDGLRYALEHGAGLSKGMDEFYGRNMPDARWVEKDFVPLAQLYAGHARIFDEEGVEFFAARDVSWSETNVAQATARRPGARAFYLLDKRAREAAGAREDVGRIVARAPASAHVLPERLPFVAPEGIEMAVRVVAAITHTIGGIRVDESARVLRADGSAITGLFAAGVDAGGVATGGYASGLAQALVLGLVAAESAFAAA
jgi:hypothetical protein